VQIDELRIIVTEQKKNVAVASEECEAMLVTIESSTQKANVKKAEASEKSVEVEIKGKQIAIEKDEAEEILAEAMPALEEARLALSQLEKAQITEIRSFATPPAAVQVVCECVAILKGYKEINWKSAKGRSCTTSTSPPLQNHSTPPLTMVTRLDGCLVDCIWASASGCGCGCICIWCSVPVLPISGGISWPERNLIMFKY